MVIAGQKNEKPYTRTLTFINNPVIRKRACWPVFHSCLTRFTSLRDRLTPFIAAPTTPAGTPLSLQGNFTAAGEAALARFADPDHLTHGFHSLKHGVNQRLRCLQASTELFRLHAAPGPAYRGLPLTTPQSLLSGNRQPGWNSRRPAFSRGQQRDVHPAARPAQQAEEHHVEQHYRRRYIPDCSAGDR